MGGTIYNNDALEPCNELGLESQRVKKFASKLHVHSVNYTAELIHTRCVLSSILTAIRTRFQVKPATLLIPIDLFSFLLVEECYGTRYQSSSFSLINVRSDFHYLPA
jgi:hypothetical protein